MTYVSQCRTRPYTETRGHDAVRTRACVDARGAVRSVNWA